MKSCNLCSENSEEKTIPKVDEIKPSETLSGKINFRKDAKSTYEPPVSYKYIHMCIALYNILTSNIVIEHSSILLNYYCVLPHNLFPVIDCNVFYTSFI